MPPRGKKKVDAEHSDLPLVPKNVTILKGESTKLYRLDSKDPEFNTLKCQPVKSRGAPKRAQPGQLFQEREIEQLAWKRHGGKQGFITHLRELKIMYTWSFPDRPFSRPDSYAPFVDSFQMDEWVWDICRKNLPFPDSAQKGGENRQVVRSLSRKYVESPYPPRPSVLRPSSASFNLLRCVLDGIPTVASMSPADGNYCVVKTQDTPEQPEKYTWSNSVLRVLASCLESVIAEHGMGAEGWDAAKWEIYDKATMALNSGLKYDAATNEWSDPSRFWLDSPVLTIGKA